MDYDLEQIDHLLSTTRAVRRRLDLERPVADELLLRCIDLAEQAPTGGNQASRRWLVVRDPRIRAGLAELYREVGLPLLSAMSRNLAGTEGSGRRVADSALHLARNLERVPVLVVVTIRGVHDASGRPGLFDSVLQAAWSFCLAARSRGLGTAWTTLHLNRAGEAAALLGIPDGVTQVVLFPVAWITGVDDLRPTARRPAREITYFDQWGFTRSTASSDGAFHVGDGVGVTVETDIDAPPERVWELVSDINLPARFSREFTGATWQTDGPPRRGGVFTGRNASSEVGHPAIGDVVQEFVGGLAWETTSRIAECDPPRVFAWDVDDPVTPERAGARWRFTLEALTGGGTRLEQSMVLGPGVSGTSVAAQRNPDREEEILTGRMRWLRHNMELTVAGIKALAEER